MTTNDPEPRQEELDELQRDIDEVRAEIEDGTPETEQRKFIERGDHGPVDDTIAPPG